MGLVQKKVIVRTKDGARTRGYLPQSEILVGEDVRLLDQVGRLNNIKINEIQTIFYVRDFNLDDQVGPERMGRSTFQARPKGDGLWVRLTFLNGDLLEGLTSFQTELADALLEDRGIYLIPPDSRGNTQRVFVPRSALSSLEVMGFVTAPSKRLAKAKELRAAEAGQTNLFGEDPGADGE